MLKRGPRVAPKLPLASSARKSIGVPAASLTVNVTVAGPLAGAVAETMATCSPPPGTTGTLVPGGPAGPVSPLQPVSTSAPARISVALLFRIELDIAPLRAVIDRCASVQRLPARAGRSVARARPAQSTPFVRLREAPPKGHHAQLLQRVADPGSLAKCVARLGRDRDHLRLRSSTVFTEGPRVRPVAGRTSTSGARAVGEVSCERLRAPSVDEVARTRRSGRRTVDRQDWSRRRRDRRAPPLPDWRKDPR